MQRYRVIEFAELNSTNQYACERLRDLNDRDAIHAGIQTAGRGRWNRKWLSEVPGNLCLSLVLKPSGAPAELPLAGLSQLLAVSVCRVLKSHSVAATLKWPNDIQVDGRKIAGILAETVVQGHEFLGLVLGIGVNLNLGSATLALVDQPATALNLVLKRTVSVPGFRDALLAEFFARYDRFLSEGFSLIRSEYRQGCVFLGREIAVRNQLSCVRGIAREITSTGELELELPDGRRQQFAVGELVFANA